MRTRRTIVPGVERAEAKALMTALLGGLLGGVQGTIGTLTPVGEEALSDWLDGVVDDVTGDLLGTADDLLGGDLLGGDLLGGDLLGGGLLGGDLLGGDLLGGVADLDLELDLGGDLDVGLGPDRSRGLLPSAGLGLTADVPRLKLPVVPPVDESVDVLGLAGADVELDPDMKLHTLIVLA